MIEMTYDKGDWVPKGLTTAVNRGGAERVIQWVHMGNLGGRAVVVSSMLPETAIYDRPEHGVVIVGRLSHLQYMLMLAQARIDARKHLEQLLDDFAARWGVDRSTTSE